MTSDRFTAVPLVSTKPGKPQYRKPEINGKVQHVEYVLQRDHIITNGSYSVFIDH